MPTARQQLQQGHNLPAEMASARQARSISLAQICRAWNWTCCKSMSMWKAAGTDTGCGEEANGMTGQGDT